jgi:hypothetical protein
VNRVLAAGLARGNKASAYAHTDTSFHMTLSKD